jgi:autotransporter translocation and assembly factor TamB
VKRLAAVLLLGLLGAAPAWLLGSEGGARWLLAETQRRVPALAVTELKGSLLSGLSAAGLRWEESARRIVVRDVALLPHWSLACLQRSIVCLDLLSAASVVVSERGTSEAGGVFPPPAPQLPLGLRIERVAIDSLTVEVAGETEEFRAIAGFLRVHQRGIEVRELGLVHDAGALSADLALTWRDDWPLRGELRVQPADALPLEGLPRAYRVELDGNLKALNLRLRSEGPAPLRPQADLRLTREAWSLDDLVFSDADGRARLRLRGSLGRPGTWRASLAVQADAFTPPLADAPVTDITGALRLVAPLDALPQAWEARGVSLSASVAGRNLLVSGDLRASEHPLLPTGMLQGRADAIAFSYARREGGAAKLTLPDGYQYRDLRLERVAGSLLPAAERDGPSLLMLRVSGDLEAQWQLQAKPAADGADWELAPFTLRIGGETVRSDSAVSGAWLRELQQLRVGAFCLRLRGTSACSDGAELGRSGSLDLALRVQERVEGQVRGKPFTVIASGTGGTSLRWEHGALAAARLAMAFDTLSLDPFAAERTAQPLHWEHVYVEGRQSGAQRQLVLDARSPQVGALHVDISEEGGALSGAARLTDLSLVALQDLVPEWGLRGGEIRGDLRIAGTREAPSAAGELALTDGEFFFPSLGVAIEDADLALDAASGAYALRGAARLGGGPLSIAGDCCDEDQLRLEVRGERNRVRLPQGLDAQLSPTLQLAMTGERLVLGGELRVHEGSYTHSVPLGEGVRRSDDIYRVDVTPRPPRRFALDAQLRTIIEPGFSLRSTNLESTLAGDLRLRLLPPEPTQLYGELQVLGGELRAWGQALRLTDGTVGFVGDPGNPALDLAAVRDIRGERLRVGVRVSGTLDAPQLVTFSDPPRSERETLSYLLRGRPPDVGASADSTSMALSLGASALNQAGALDPLNNIAGLSGLTLGAEGEGEDTVATISGYVGNRLYLSYGMGIYEPVNSLTARLYLRSRLWLEVVSRLESSFDLYYRFDRD